MKVSRMSKGFVLALAVLLAASAFAANQGSLQLSDSVTVGGKQLAPGDYKLRWDGNGPNIELNIVKGKNVVTTVPARLVDLSRSADRDAIVTRISGDGNKTVSEIRLSGKKYALALGGESAKADSGDSSSK